MGHSFDLSDRRSGNSCPKPEFYAEDRSEILAGDRSRHPSIWQVKGVSLLLIEISKLVLLALIMETTPVLGQEWNILWPENVPQLTGVANVFGDT